MERLPNIVVVDSVGATETGMNGIKIATKGEKQHGGPATVQPSLDSIVVDEDLQPHRARAPGKIGRLARTGNIPLGYYKDPERSAQVFFEHDGKRYSIPGDFATVEADGQVTLLGRGSIVINTGGEKVFPEEVEGVLKAHPDVFDVLVVGVPDERWGERVTAVVQARDGQGADGRGARRALPDADRRVQGAEAGVPRRRDQPGAERQARLPVGEGVREGRGRGADARRVARRGRSPTFEAAGLYDPTAPDARRPARAARAPRRRRACRSTQMVAADAIGSLHAARRPTCAIRPGRRRTIERGRRRGRGSQRRPAPPGHVAAGRAHRGRRLPRVATSETFRLFAHRGRAVRRRADPPVHPGGRVVAGPGRRRRDLVVPRQRRGPDAAAGRRRRCRCAEAVESAVDALDVDPERDGRALPAATSQAAITPPAGRRTAYDGGPGRVPARDRLRRPRRLHAAHAEDVDADELARVGRGASR